jgi:hypothetical protein
MPRANRHCIRGLAWYITHRCRQGRLLVGGYRSRWRRIPNAGQERLAFKCEPSSDGNRRRCTSATRTGIALYHAFQA